MQVQVPQGCVAGQMLQIQAPNGQILQVAIPQGMGAGSVFQVQVPSSQPVQQQPQQQTGPDPMALFAAVDTDRSGSISDIELSQALSTGGMAFSRKTCRYLIGMHDRDRSGTIDRNEFSSLWGYLQQWKACFDRSDTDHGGSIDFNELQVALKQFGYNTMGSEFYASVMRAYDEDKSGSIGMDEFIQLNCELHNLTATFKQLPADAQGRAMITYEQFLQMTYSVR
jgi:Ca2+-binding EF-hand superfamily protein